MSDCTVVYFSFPENYSIWSCVNIPVYVLSFCLSETGEKSSTVFIVFVRYVNDILWNIYGHIGYYFDFICSDKKCVYVLYSIIDFISDDKAELSFPWTEIMMGN